MNPIIHEDIRYQKIKSLSEALFKEKAYKIIRGDYDFIKDLKLDYDSSIIKTWQIPKFIHEKINVKQRDLRIAYRNLPKKMIRIWFLLDEIFPLTSIHKSQISDYLFKELATSTRPDIKPKDFSYHRTAVYKHNYIDVLANDHNIAEEIFNILIATNIYNII